MWPPEINNNKYGNSIFLLIFGLSAWPSKWFTATKGFFKDPASAFPIFKPTVKQTINPGPAVAAMPSKFSKFKPLSSIAFWTMNSIFSTWALAAISGTIPPNALCSSIWLETIFDKISPVPLFFSFIIFNF